MENGLNEENLFFDTYALIEIFNGNKNYERYKKVGAVTSYFHLYELYYNLKKDHEEKIFYDFFLFLTGLCVNLNFGWIKEAVEFEMQRGGQVYFLHNRIDSIDHVQNTLQKLIPAATIAYLHGRMPEHQIMKVMDDFKKKKDDRDINYQSQARKQ